MTTPFSYAAERMQPSAIRLMTKLAAGAGPDLITFAGGMPNAATFPLEELARYASEEVHGHGGRNLQYGMTAGTRSLIQWICEYVKGKGISATPDEVLCTSGSQQGINLIAEILIDRDDYLIVERPTYLGALMVFHKTGATYVTVSQDSNGMDLEDLESKLKNLPARRKKLIYITSNFQNPSGISLSAERRKILPEILDRYDAYLIEDDPYGEIYFDSNHAPPPPVSACRSDRIFYLGTASKLVAPTFRTGWVVAPEPLMKKIELAKEASDLCGSILDQRIVYRFFSSSAFPGHLEKLRSFYKGRFQAMESALEKEMPAGVSWTKPSGGFFIWVKLPEHLDSESFLEESILEEKVSYVIGRPFTSDDSARNFLRLAYSVENPDRIKEGIGRLASVIRKRM